MTSASNAAFVSETGYFDEVIVYDAIGGLQIAPSIFIDMAGSATVRSALHHHLKDCLRYSCAVGGAHWEDPGRASGLPGPRPSLFFAPGRAEKRTADWGRGELQKRIDDVWVGFCESVTEWLEISEHRGRRAVESLYRSVLEGQISPRSAAMAGVHD